MSVVLNLSPAYMTFIAYGNFSTQNVVSNQEVLRFEETSNNQIYDTLMLRPNGVSRGNQATVYDPSAATS